MSERDGFVFINGAAPRGAVHQAGRGATTIRPGTWPRVPAGQYFFMGDNRAPVLRLARLGIGAAQEPDRRGLLRLLAADIGSRFPLDPLLPLGPPGLSFV